MRANRLLCCLAICIAVSGCGKKEPNGIVSGKVTFDGVEVKEGSVLFTSKATSFGGEVPIKSDGTYQVRTEIGGLPPGKYQIAVMWPKEAVNASKNSPGTLVPREVDNIPKRYTSTKTSNLEVDVPDGGTTFDIQMTK